MDILIPKRLRDDQWSQNVRRDLPNDTERVFQCTLFAFDVLFQNQCGMSDSEYSLSLPEAEAAVSAASAEEAGKREIRLMTSFLCNLLPAYCLILVLNKFI